MRKTMWLKILALSLSLSITLGIASIFLVRDMNKETKFQFKSKDILFVTKFLESAPFEVTVRDYERFSGYDPESSRIWVLSETGNIIAANKKLPVPAIWKEINKPLRIHEIVLAHRGFFQMRPGFALVRLDRPSPTYLLIEPQGNPLFQRISFRRTVVFLGVLVSTVFLSLAVSALYLRKKSRQARDVIARIERGELNARFEIHQLDEVGSLMKDFNQMASKIERLVCRVRETEAARRDLLQELSHDLRTPLTSLRTSVETLTDHFEEMPKTERVRFFNVIQTELGYFLKLVENLFFLAELAEPRYKKSTEEIDLNELLEGELENRRSGHSPFTKPESAIHWNFLREGVGDYFVLGDKHLLQRLFRNALDNAARFAKSDVTLRLSRREKTILIAIEDDGPGISDFGLASFGRRQKRRTSPGKIENSLSIGLGSVIMKSILELHEGQLKIERRNANAPEGTEGTRLTLSFLGFEPG